MKTTNNVVPLTLMLMLLVTAACGPVRTVTPLAPETQPAVGASTPVSGSGAPATEAPPAGPTSSAAANSGPASGPVALQVLAPQDGSVVNTAQVQVTGAAAPGTVVTVNDDILIVGADGTFQSTVALQEGPNLIDVVASNASGSEADVQITVTYEP